MLVTERREGLVCVTQYEHGGVAGALAERWGNARFAMGEPRAPLIIAAARHDDGWHGLDDVPALNRELGRPAHFLEIPLPNSIAAYAGGVEDVYSQDVHAGVLVSMHWSGLYSGRFGLAGGSPPLEAAAARATVREQERRWHETAYELWNFRALRSAFYARLWHSYEVLQALDLLSLFLCLTDLDQPTDGAAPTLAMGGTLRDVRQPPGARTVASVPTVPGGEHVELTVSVVEPRVVTVAPSPFASAELEVDVPLRTLPERRYATDYGAAEAYHHAPLTPVRVAIVAG